MKTIGLIGGMSWESSLEYYRILNQTVKARLGGLHSSKCLLYSFDFKEIEELQHLNKWDDMTRIMIEAGLSLKKGGADFIVICTNTMHRIAEEVEKDVGIKVLHIAEATGNKIAQKGLKRVGLLGTRFTMEGDFYKKVLKERYNIEVLIPEEKEREFIHNVIYNELCKGELNSNSREKFKEIIKKLSLNGAEGVVLGCTEIPLLIKQEDVDIPVFDTMTIHGVAAVEYALED